MSLKTRKLSHVYSVDGLRALALLGVILFHMWPSSAPGGYFGVLIFFVIAGFFVSRNFVLEQSDGRYPSLARYYRKRFIRLYMPLLAMVVIVNLFSAAFAKDIYAYGISDTPSVLLGFNNIYQSLSGASYFESHGVFKPFTHLWALSLELQFYFIYPLCIRFMAFIFKNNVSRISLVLWVVSVLSGLYMAFSYVPGTDPTVVYYSSLSRIFSFTIGGAFAFSNILSLEKISLAKVGGGDFNGPQGQISSLANRGFYKMGPTPFQSLLALIILIILIIPFFTLSYNSSIPFRGGMFLYSVLVAYFIVLVYHDDVFLTPILACAPFRFLAQRSYSYYIWQYPIMMIFASILIHSTFPNSLSNLIQLALLLLIGEISYRLLERGPKQRPYLKTPELAAGIAPILGFATLVMFVVALVLPVKAPDNDAELIKQKIAEAQREDQLLRQQREQLKSQELSSPSPMPQTQDVSRGDSASQDSVAKDLSNKQQPAPANNSLTEPQEDQDFKFSPEQLERLKTIKVSIIGDSVTDMSREYLVKYLYNLDLDAKISRQMTTGLELVKEKKAQGILGDYVVISLGANGDFNSSVLDEFLSEVKPSKLLLMNAVCPDPHEQSVNSKLKKFVETHAQDGVYLIDWYGAAKRHKEYFYRDATHPKPQGVKVYDRLILEALIQASE